MRLMDVCDSRWLCREVIGLCVGRGVADGVEAAELPSGVRTLSVAFGRSSLCASVRLARDELATIELAGDTIGETTRFGRDSILATGEGTRFCEEPAMTFGGTELVRGVVVVGATGEVPRFCEELALVLGGIVPVGGLIATGETPRVFEPPAMGFGGVVVSK